MEQESFGNAVYKIRICSPFTSSYTCVFLSSLPLTVS